LGAQLEDRLRRVPSGTHDVFRPEAKSATERRDVRQARFGVSDEHTKVILMVQRLSGEKGTDRIFPAFVAKEEGGHGIKAVLAVAGDGPSKATLVAQAKSLNIPVVFMGNVPHQELPELYRAADCFVTMSLSETYGLTCLEAMMCGCPAVMPYCAVFNEIWDERTPKGWRYEITDLAGLAAAIAAAQESGRAFLVKNPVRQTWKDATDLLLEQYEECIAMNAKKRATLKEMIGFMDHCIRIVLCTVAASWVLRRYYLVLKSFGSWVAPF
jgi:glycosyltransferase involved in cell wall biosynthesis